MKKVGFFITVMAALILAGNTIILTGCRKTKEDITAQGPKIAGMIFGEDQFFRLVQFGMKDAAEKAGARLFISNSNSQLDKEIQLVNTYIVRKVDAIVISPLSAKASATALKRAHDKGIKIITYNTTVEEDIPQAYIESNQSDLGIQTGKAARKYIEEKLGGKAKIAILAFKTILPESSDARSGGFKSQITDLPAVEIVAEQDAWMPETALKKSGDILTANPDIDIIWGANEGATIGSVLAVLNAGKAGKIAVFGTDTSEQLLNFLLSDDNILQAVTGQRPFEMGYIAVESALKILQGQEVEKVVSMPGILLSRQQPDIVMAFQEKRRELISKGSD